MSVTVKKSTLGMLLAGAGLILLGAVALLLLPRSESRPSAAAVIPAQVSYAAPALELNDLEGRTVSLDELRGQVVLVNLWATWCPPCKEEMPELEAFYQRYKQSGFTIVAINDGESAPVVRAFVAEYRLTFPVWLDPDYVATEEAFKAINLPSSFLIDRGGTIRLRWVGAVDLPILEEYVTPFIVE